MLDWLVIGAGVHGTTITVSLLERARITPNTIRMVDPLPPLSRWSTRTSACGMTHLRSPGAHGLEPDFGSLRKFAGTDWLNETRGRYRTPTTELFGRYAQDVVRRHRLDRLHVPSSVVDLVQTSGGAWRAMLDSGEDLETRNVILAIGSDQGASAPKWIADLQSDRAWHVYDRPPRHILENARDVIVVGGGVAACQLALSLSSKRVSLITRRELQCARFDSDPCFIGPACLRHYLALPRSERRVVLRTARRPGTVPPEVLERVQSAVQSGAIAHLVAEVTGATSSERGVVVQTQSGPQLTADVLIAATGLNMDIGTHPLIKSQVQRGLPADGEGLPLLEEDLSWAPGLICSGRLAELELGPSAPNIIGSHAAAKRIVSAYWGKLRTLPVSWSAYSGNSSSRPISC